MGRPCPRARASVLVFTLLLSVAAAACRRPTGCPPGTRLAERAADDALWCRSPDGAKAFWVQFYPGEKQRRQSCPFLGKALEGPFEAWHPNGKRSLSGDFAGGRPQGPWVQLGASGDKVAHGNYRDGQLVSGAPVAVAAACDRVRP